MHFKRIAIAATAGLLLLFSALGNSLPGHAGGHGIGTRPHSDLVKNVRPDG